MSVLVGALIIVVGALGIAAINEYIEDFLIAIVVEVFLLALAISIFVWLR